MYDRILFMLANHKIRHQATRKMGRMVIADGHLIFLWGLCGYALINTHFITPGVTQIWQWYTELNTKLQVISCDEC